MNILLVAILILSTYLIVSGIYEEKIEQLKMKETNIKYEYIPATSFDNMITESNEVITY